MSNSPAHQSISPKQFERAWRLVTASGSLGTIYAILCVVGAPRTKFLLEIGATAFHFGLISGGGALAVTFQILSGLMASRLKRRKPFFIFFGILHRVLTLGVLAVPMLFLSPSVRLWWIIAILFAHDSIANLTIPVWYAWMAEIVPQDSINRHWAIRQRRNTVTNIIASLALACFFWFFEEYHQIYLGFSIVAIVGLVCGIFDIALFAKVPDPPSEPHDGSSLFKMLIQPLGDRDFRAYFIFNCVWTLAVSIGGPFFLPFMLDNLHLSSFITQIIITASTLGVVVTARFWGVLCDNYGQRPILQISVIGKALIPFAALITPAIPSIAIPWLTLAFFLDGLTNCSLMLSTQGVLLKSTPRRSRPMYIASISFLAGIIGFIGSTTSGWMISHFQNTHLHFWVYAPNGYHLMFAISFIIRLSSCYFAARIHEPQAANVGGLINSLRDGSAFRVASLIHRLNECKEEKGRLAIIRLLGHTRNVLTARELIRLLEDDNPKIRRAAAHALGHIRMAEASESLGRALTAPDSSLQSLAAHALGEIGDYSSLQALLTHLQNLPPESMGETVDALAKIGDSGAILPLICLYNDTEDPVLRQKIARALGTLSETESEEEVLAVLGENRRE